MSHSKSVEQSNAPSRGLSGTLGVTSIVLIVIATAAPLTVMVANTPLIISMGNGAAAPLDALIGTVAMLLFAIGFVTMSRYITNCGAFYSYIQKGLGRIVGLGSATMALSSYFFILIALEAYIGFAISDLIRSFFSLSIPWWAIGLSIVALTGVLGWHNIELSSKCLGVALVLEIGIVMLVNAAILMDKGIGGLTYSSFSVQAFNTGSPALGVMFVILCFIGFEATVVFRDEARDPDRTIPMATYASVIIIGIFYLVSMWLEVTGFGADQVLAMAKDHPGDMYLILTERFIGTTAKDIMQFLLVTSLFACTLSMHNIVVRYQYILGKFGVIHPRVAAVHASHGSPHVSSLLQSVCSFVILGLLAAMGLDPVTEIYTWGVTTCTIGYMAVLVLTSASVIAFFWGDRKGHSVWKTLVAPFLGLVSVLGCLWVTIENLPSLVGGANADKAAQLMVWVVIATFLAGIVGAFYFRACRSARYEALRELA